MRLYPIDSGGIETPGLTTMLRLCSCPGRTSGGGPVVVVVVVVVLVVRLVLFQRRSSLWSFRGFAESRLHHKERLLVLLLLLTTTSKQLLKKVWRALARDYVDLERGLPGASKRRELHYGRHQLPYLSAATCYHVVRNEVSRH